MAGVDSERSIGRLIALAGRIEQVVEAVTPVLDRFVCRDRNEQVLVASYGRAARCFRSMRLLAEQRLGEDALVLCRTLFSVAVHSLYLTNSEDSLERRSRLDCWIAGFLFRLDRQERELAAWNLQQEDLDALRELRDRLRGGSAHKIERFPDERSITKVLGDPWPLLYSQVFRTASEATHFSMAAALDAFEQHSKAARVVRWQHSDASQVNDALLYGVLTYGSFLDAADSILTTGAAAKVTPLIRRSGVRAI